MWERHLDVVAADAPALELAVAAHRRGGSGERCTARGPADEPQLAQEGKVGRGGPGEGRDVEEDGDEDELRRKEPR